MGATSAKQAETVERPLRTRRYIAALCGVSEATVKRWVASREIPHTRLPGTGTREHVRFDEADVRAWLAERRVERARFDTPERP